MGRTLALLLALLALRAAAENTAQPAGEPAAEPATLHCIGAYWIIRGDDNRNAAIAVDCRKAGETEWTKAAPLFRVETGAHQPNKHASMPGKCASKIDVPSGAWLFAGSVVMLLPDTAYEMRLTLSDPDGGSAEHVLKCRTREEPLAPANLATRHVIPGNGGGSGTAADPYKGVREAHRHAQPGTLFLLHAGVYEGQTVFGKSGEPGKPIVWRGAGDGETIFDGKGKPEKNGGRIISIYEAHDVWFENLTVRNGLWGITANLCSRIVVRRCRIHNIVYGIAAVLNTHDNMSGYFISDNTVEGPSVWPRTEEKGIEAARGIQIVGSGHVICYNRVRGFADAIDTFQDSPRCSAIDIHNNDLSELTDDGIELDYSERNVRCFNNRLTNVFQGISTQPVYGGPVYIFRNAIYNVDASPLKLNQSPSGVLVYHNTIVKRGAPMAMQGSSKTVRNCVFRNNLFAGTKGDYAFEILSPLKNCDMDFDGFAGGPYRNFLKCEGVRYSSLEEVKQKAPIYRHAIWVDGLEFASGVKPPGDATKQYESVVNDLRLKPGSAAMDAGEKLPGFNDGFSGAAPDLGAYEAGTTLPHYGPRPEK